MENIWRLSFLEGKGRQFLGADFTDKLRINPSFRFYINNKIKFTMKLTGHLV